MARRARRYKTVNVATKSGGSTGAQTLVGSVTKIDAQGITGFLNNVRLTVMIDEAEQDSGSIIGYLTTHDEWSDDYVITAAATPGGPGGTLNLVGKRRIESNEESYVALSNTGPVYLWVEIADYVASESFRYVAETWGFGIEFNEL